MPPPGRAERTESDTPPRLIAFRRLTLRSATGTPQRGGPCYELCQAKSVRDLFFSLKAFFLLGRLSSWVRGLKRFLGIGNGVSHCSTCYPCTALKRDGTS